MASSAPASSTPATTAKKGGAPAKDETRARVTKTEGGRHKTKKDGGGRGGWGKPGDEMYLAPVDKGDPNYDEEGAAANRHKTMLSAVTPLPSLEEFKGTYAHILGEYLAGGEVQEVVQALRELNLEGTPLAAEIVKRSLITALGRKQRERELVSRLLVSLSAGRILDQGTAWGGFKLLISEAEYMQDLLLDNPDGCRVLAQFLARAVVDEVIGAAALEDKGGIVNKHAESITELASLFLKQDHAAARVAKIWGPGDGRPVEDVKKDICMLVGEFASTHDAEEAARCVREIDTGMYMHELVKQLVVTSIDKPEAQQRQALDLLAHLSKEELLDEVRMEQGFGRCLERMEDLELDVPKALETFKDVYVAGAVELKLLPASFAERCVPKSAIKSSLKLLVDDYLMSGDAEGAAKGLLELNVPHLHAEMVKLLMVRAMDKAPKERALASRLVLGLRRTDTVTAAAVHTAFEALQSSMRDVELDVPDAPSFLLEYVAAATHEGLLPEDFLARSARGGGVDSPRSTLHEVTGTTSK